MLRPRLQESHSKQTDSYIVFLKDGNYVFCNFRNWKCSFFSCFFFQRRGVQSRKMLPYFPYRDDGKLIYRKIKCMVWQYVRTWVFEEYYRNVLWFKKKKKTNEKPNFNDTSFRLCKNMHRLTFSYDISANKSRQNKQLRRKNFRYFG